MSTYPNPLDINFGQGRIIVAKWSDKTERGIVFIATKETNKIGDKVALPSQESHTPKEGEIYLRFKNIESARVVYETLGEMISEWNSHDPAPAR